MKGDIFQYMLHMLRVKFTATTCKYTNQNDKTCTSSLLSTMKMEHLLKSHAQEMEHLSSLDFTIFISTSVCSLNFYLVLMSYHMLKRWPTTILT